MSSESGQDCSEEEIRTTRPRGCELCAECVNVRRVMYLLSHLLEVVPRGGGFQAVLVQNLRVNVHEEEPQIPRNREDFTGGLGFAHFYDIWMVELVYADIVRDEVCQVYQVVVR